MRENFAPLPQGLFSLQDEALRLGEVFRHGEVIRLAAADATGLRAAVFRPEGEARGTLFLLQGRGEFIEKYAEVIGEIIARGFALATLDWRGQGGSERRIAHPRKGHVADFAHYEADLAALIAAARRAALPEPFVLLAHSTGAAVALLHLARGASPFQRAVLVAPLVAIGGLRWPAGASALARLLARLGMANCYLPGGGDAAAHASPFEGNPLTGDRPRYELTRAWYAAAPDLALGQPTLGWVAAAFRALRAFQCPGFGRNNRTPLLMILAAADKVTEPRAAAELAARMPAAASITLAAARHEILFEGEVIRAAFWAAFDAFLQPLAGEGRANPAEETRLHS